MEQDINLSDLQVDWLKWHDLVMANRTSSIPHDLSCMIPKSCMTV